MIQLRGSDFKRWLDNASSSTRMFVAFTLKIPKGVIVLGHNLKYLFRDFFPEHRIYVVPNGGNYHIPEHQYNTDYPVKLIYLANLQSSKGIEDVIDAITILQREQPGTFVMDIIGEWRNEAVGRTAWPFEHVAILVRAILYLLRRRDFLDLVFGELKAGQVTIGDELQ